MAYDPKCEELAEYFLGNGVSVPMRKRLAQELQDCVEDWIADQRERLKLSINWPEDKVL